MPKKIKTVRSLAPVRLTVPKPGTQQKRKGIQKIRHPVGRASVRGLTKG